MADFEDSGVLVDVRAAVRRQGGSLRSPLYQWMDRNHDELLALFRQAPPRWERVTAVLAGRGSAAATAGRFGPSRCGGSGTGSGGAMARAR